MIPNPAPPPDSHDNRSAPSQSVDSDTEARVSFTGVTVVDPSVPAKTPEEIPFHPNPDAENVTDFVSIWSSKTSSASDFGEFSNVCEALAPAVVEKGKGMSNNTSGRRRIPRPAPHRPNRRSPHPHRTRPQNNPIEARRLQTLFRLSKKRAARQILKDNNAVYSGSKDQAHQHFSDTFATKHADIDELVHSLRDHVPSAREDPNLMAPLTDREIRRKLMSTPNSAPGKDKVEYRHLKLVDPGGSLLQLVFNRCLSEKNIPFIWKHATTIPTYKKGDSSDPSNFRPTALMSCLHKLFTSLMAARAPKFAVDNNLMSSEQKSARPSEGCHEHTPTLQSIVADCKRNNKNCFFAWLDLRNALGSISHEATHPTLTHMGFPEPLVDLIKDIYSDATTTVKTSKSDETDSIEVNAGVKQGCPISPILFNPSSELLIRSIAPKCNENSDIAFKLHGQPTSILAYADDLVLISRTREGLQEIPDGVSSAANVLKLSPRPDKCCTLSPTRGKNEVSRVSSNLFRVQELETPFLTKDESFRYLGVPIGLTVRT
jgi:hypothetical protein